MDYFSQLKEVIQKTVNYDVDEYFLRLRKAIDRNKDSFKYEVFTTIRNYPIIFITPNKMLDRPRVLIAAGFHGDESSGPWAVLNFLESNLYSESGVNLSLLPLVNPTGFNLSRRSNFWGHQPNRGYARSYDMSKSSEEDVILKKNSKYMSKYAKDCLTTMHEDDEERFYIYTYGEEDSLETKLISMGESKFGLVPKDRLEIMGFKSRRDGVIVDDKDGSFEHLMINRGVRRVITTENPARRKFQDRVTLYIEMMKEICKSKYYK